MLIGPVRNVYGKERAKTEIAKHALPIIVQEAKKMGFTILGLEGFEPEEQSTDGTESEPPGESGHNGAEDEEIWEDASDGVNIGSGMMGQVDCNAAGVVGLRYEFQALGLLYANKGNVVGEGIIIIDA